MGIDLGRRTRHRSVRKAPSSKDNHLALTVKLYRFLNRRATSKFNSIVLQRLYKSRNNRPPVAISTISKSLSGKSTIGVVVGTVTDDIDFEKIGSVKVCALRFTEPARKRILEAGGECLTFDQLALRCPKGENTMLFRGSREARDAFRHFGNPGLRNSDAVPYCKSKGRKFEHTSRTR